MIFGLDKGLSDASDEMLGKNAGWTEAAGERWGAQALDPEMKKMVLPKYPESIDFPAIGFKGDGFSLTCDGENLTFSYSSTFSFLSTSVNLLNGDITSISAYGVETSVSSEAGAFLPKIGFSSSYGEKKGNYLLRDWEGNVKDYGTIAFKSASVGGSAGEIEVGVGAEKETKQSAMTGVIEVKNSMSYDFNFVTISK